MRTVLTNIGQLATMTTEGGLRVYKDATLVFEDGIVQSVEERLPQGNAIETLDAGGAVVLPGFVDAHTHLVFGGDRVGDMERRARGLGYQDIAKAGGGIMDTVRKTREASEDELFEAGLSHLTWCVRNGTTTLEAKSGYGLDLQTELHILLAMHRVDVTFRQSLDEAEGYRVFPTFLGLHAVPPEFATKEDYVDFVLDDMLTVVQNAGLATAVDAFVEDGYFDAADARRLASRARELGLSLRLHVDQLADGEGASLAAQLGAVTADHLERANVEGISALAAAGTIPVLLPASVFGLGLTKYPDARTMLDAGLPVVLATDFNPGSSPTPSLPFVAAIAVRTMRMTPAECLAAITCNAAKSLGLSDRGRLEPGLKADFSVWPVKDWREIMYWIDGPRPSQVWANGRRLN